ncbi:hypothetical protein [Bradyrhizobium sp. RT4b]|uniref:hypothetical protein n=1 Tax=Bradyrhizobium sp. RT4b TaxID=3156379 RepID=UPI003399A327
MAWLIRRRRGAACAASALQPRGKWGNISMDRRQLVRSLAAAACAAALPVGAKASGVNQIIGGGFINGVGEHNVIVGDETTARDAILNNCVIDGRGAAIGTRAQSTSCIGDSCGMYGDFELCEISGQYAARKARLRKVAANGYSALEYGDAEDSSFEGLYSGHSCYARHSQASGVQSLAGAIVTRTIVSGRDAGAMAEGEDLVMHGAYVTTARLPGPQLRVSEIQLDRERGTPWIVKGHGLGAPGARVNLFVFADEMPQNKFAPWSYGVLLPFSVLDPDAVGYAGNKYYATAPGRNVRVAINTCKPKRSVAIGKGSVISRDDQIVINGLDLTGEVSRLDAIEGRLKLLEHYVP